MEHDLKNGWKLVEIITRGYEGWFNLVPTDPNSVDRPTGPLPPEVGKMLLDFVR